MVRLIERAGMTPKKDSVEQQEVVIPDGSHRVGMILHLKGTTPLIIHSFGHKARTALEAKKGGTAVRGKRAPKGPDEIADEVLEASYFVKGRENAPPTEGRYGIRTTMLKNAAVSAANKDTDLAQNKARTAFFVVGEVVPIQCSRVEPHEDPVRLGGIQKIMSLTYRPYYFDWSIDVAISYSPGLITRSQLINLFAIAGQEKGLGERRPTQRCGESYGLFSVIGADVVSPEQLPMYEVVMEPTPLLVEAHKRLQAMGMM